MLLTGYWYHLARIEVVSFFYRPSPDKDGVYYGIKVPYKFAEFVLFGDKEDVKPVECFLLLEDTFYDKVGNGTRKVLGLNHPKGREVCFRAGLPLRAEKKADDGDGSRSVF